MPAIMKKVAKPIKKTKPISPAKKKLKPSSRSQSEEEESSNMISSPSPIKKKKSAKDVRNHTIILCLQF